MMMMIDADLDDNEDDFNDNDDGLRVPCVCYATRAAYDGACAPMTLPAKRLN